MISIQQCMACSRVRLAYNREILAINFYIAAIYDKHITMYGYQQDQPKHFFSTEKC